MSLQSHLQCFFNCIYNAIPECRRAIEQFDSSRENSMTATFLFAASTAYERSSLCSAIRSADPGFQIVGVDSGKAAIAKLRSGSFDGLVCGELLDVNPLPLVRMIRAGRCGNASIPVIILTVIPSMHSLRCDDLNTHFFARKSFADTASGVLNLFSNSRRPKVLVVSEDVDRSNVIVRGLSEQYEISLSCDPIAALPLWREKQHDLIIMDSKLSKLSCHQLQTVFLHYNPMQPIVVISDEKDLRMGDRFILGGAKALVPAKFDGDLYSRTIDDVLRERCCEAMDRRSRLAFGELHRLVTYVHAAQFALSRGQVAIASRHVSSAIATCPDEIPSDDELLDVVLQRDEIETRALQSVSA